VCGDVAAYIGGSGMNKRLSSFVITEYSKQYAIITILDILLFITDPPTYAATSPHSDVF
jgi:hypothetical protein